MKNYFRRAPFHAFALSATFLAFAPISKPAKAQDNASSVVSAEQLGAPPSSEHSAEISNLNYYPHAGKILFTPQFSTALSDQSVSGNASGTTTGQSTIATSSASLAASYGITQRLRVSLSETALLGTDTTHTTTSSGATTLSQSSGLSDPTLGTTLRYLEDETRSGLSADIGVSVSPTWVSHYIANAQQNGSEGKGYGTLTLSAPLYWWAGHNEIELNPSITRDFDGNNIGQTQAASSIRSSAWLGSVACLDRFHFGDRFYAQAGATLDLPYAVQTTALNTAGTVSTTQYPFYLVPRIDLGYRFSQSVLFVTEFQYFNYSTSVLQTLNTNQSVESSLAFRFLIQI